MKLQVSKGTWAAKMMRGETLREVFGVERLTITVDD